MTWIAGEVDGVVIKRRSIIGTGEWSAVKDRIIALMAAQLSDRLDMGESVADSFADGGDVSGGVCTSGYVKNTESGYVPAVPAVPGGNAVPTMTSNTTPSGVCSASGSHYEGSSINYLPFRAVCGINGADGFYIWHSAGGTGLNCWWQYAFPAVQAISGYSFTCSPYGSYYQYHPKTWTFCGSNNGSSWVTLDSRSGQIFSAGQKRSYTLSGTRNYRYYRFNITDNGSSTTAASIIGELELIAPGTPYQPAIPAHPDPTVITVSPYTPDNTLEKVRVTLMLQDMANSGALSVGSSSSDLIQAYLSYDGNSSFGSALGFSEEPEEFTAGANIYVFNSNEVDVSAETISSIGLKLQSFDRGSGAPAFRWHAYIIAGKEVESE